MVNCSRCGKQDIKEYGRDRDDNYFCYDCCTLIDIENLLSGDPYLLYWHEGIVSNWPGSLKIIPYNVTYGKHNWGLIKTNVWFELEGKNFYGYHIGNYTEILHVKMIKDRKK